MNVLEFRDMPRCYMGFWGKAPGFDLGLKKFGGYSVNRDLSTVPSFNLFAYADLP